MRSSILLLTGLIVLNFSSLAQITAPKYSNEFLAIGVGARGMAMSNVQAALVDDVTSGYWNPAGLTRMKHKYEAALMHAEYFAGIAKYDYGAVAMQVDSSSAVGLSVIRFGVDDIPDTRYLFDSDGNNNGQINYNNLRYFSSSDYAFILTYGRKIHKIKGLSLGANFKVIYRNAGDFANAWGFGLDAGAQLHRKKWLFGLMLRDVTGTFNAWTYNPDLVQDVYAKTGNAIPQNSIEVTLPRIIGGVARSFQLSKKIGLTASTDLIFTFDGQRNTVVHTSFVSIDPAVGLEANYKKIVFLRAGIGNVQQVQSFNNKTYTSVQPNFGVGIKIYKFTIDYALTNIGDVSESLYSNVFSVKFSFDSL
ncbi:MAG TPA: PorV/PorQ family protein [Cytophagaceae bacterium]|jgi:hypothetical protein|nr:PorV/PorQ family protein [Cytophagaceae bacterium]